MPDFSVESGSRTRLTFASWGALLLVGMIGLGQMELEPRKSTGRQEGAAQPGCLASDREASEGIAALIFDKSASAELRLDEAILQLRRARKNCRMGSIDLAGHDYTSLHRAFPIPTGSIRIAPHAQ